MNLTLLAVSAWPVLMRWTVIFVANLPFLVVYHFFAYALVRCLRNVSATTDVVPLRGGSDLFELAFGHLYGDGDHAPSSRFGSMWRP